MTLLDTRRRLVLGAVLAPAALIATGLAALPSASAEGVAEAEWNVVCEANHFAADDPIVFPNQPGKSHMHSFFGNPTTNAATTAETLQSTPSTCNRGMGTSDRSGYWEPSLLKNNADGSQTVVKNTSVTVYYRRVGTVNGPKVTPIPIGLRIVAGDSMAKSPQPLSIVEWDCARGGPQTPGIPTCPDPNQPVHANVVFPNCWDGKHLDSADHKSHMSYSSASGNCDAAHPVLLPQLTIESDYWGNTGGPSYTLASGGVYSMHADFFAAWDSRVQNALVTTCLNNFNECADINREGDSNILFRPTYDPYPITIDLNNFSASPPFVPEPVVTPSSTATMPGMPDMTPTPTTTPPATSTTIPVPASSTTAPAASPTASASAPSTSDAAPVKHRRHHRPWWQFWS
jgi:hypothetical protein